MKKLIILVSLFIFFCELSAQEYSFVYDGINRSYIVHVPSSYDGSKPYSLILALHGYNTDPSNFSTTYTASGFQDPRRAEAFEYIVVFPYGSVENGNRGWNIGQGSGFSTDDVGFISSLIDTMKSRYNINSNKIFATGHSNGAFMCYRLAVELSNKIAAVAPVEGLLDVAGLEDKIKKPIPILHIHALNDPTVPYTGMAGFAPGVDSLMKIWKHHNQCVDIPDTICNQPGVIGYEWRAPATGADVALYQFTYGGHSWLSNPLNSTDLVIDFFYNHPKLMALKMASPANNTTYPLHSNIEISATPKSTEVFAKIIFYANQSILSDIENPPYTLTWNDAPAGGYAVYAKGIYSTGDTVLSMQPSYINVLLPNIAVGKPTECSAIENTSYPAQNVTDGNFGTRWSTPFSDPQWISIDLQDTCIIKGVTLFWEAAYGVAYSIDVSSDDLNWKTVYSTAYGDGGTDDISFSPIEDRYIRMYGTKRSTAYGYSLWEFQVHGDLVNRNSVSGSNKINSQLDIGSSPNPFSIGGGTSNNGSGVTIRYNVPKDGHVELII